MSWKSKTKLIQGFLSIKRPIDFVPHGNMEILDSEMHGNARFCKKLEGDYVSLVSDMSIIAADAINIGDAFVVVAGWINVPKGALLSLDNKEFVVVSYSEYTRLSQDPTQKQTYLHVEKSISRSYVANTSLLVVGFPVSLVGPYAAGSSVLMFDTALMSVPGDSFARFRYEDDIPVLDAWQKIDAITDKSEFKDDNDNTIRRYYCLLEKPLQRSLDQTTQVFIKSTPAYQSKVLPLDLYGSYHVDAFTGKTFGTGADDLEFSITLYDAHKVPVSTANYKKNDVLVISSFLACDMSLWRVGDGSINTNKTSIRFVLDNDSHFSIGHVFTAQQVSFRSNLSCIDDFTLFVQTTSGRIKIESTAGKASFEVNEVTDHIVIEILGRPSSVIHVSNDDATSRVNYLSYSYCADIDVTESWEGASLILKPCFDKLSDLHADIDNVTMDSGVILQ